MRAEVVKGRGGRLHSSVLDVLHGADHFLVDLGRRPCLTLRPRPNALALNGFRRCGFGGFRRRSRLGRWCFIGGWGGCTGSTASLAVGSSPGRSGRSGVATAGCGWGVMALGATEGSSLRSGKSGVSAAMA